MKDNREDSHVIAKFTKFADHKFATIGYHEGTSTDGENLDSAEHFFWGMENGVAIELGALDGTRNTHSMTQAFQLLFNWRRILIEGNPEWRSSLAKLDARVNLGVNAAVCDKPSQLHFLRRSYASGIAEFMPESYLKAMHKQVYSAGSPPGNLSTVDWDAVGKIVKIDLIDCLPLAAILETVNVKHVNFFILDTEGGELNVLRSIDFSKVTFDVIAVESNVSPFDDIKNILEPHGYFVPDGIPSPAGRNSWFIRKGFVPSKRPGRSDGCFRGAAKCVWERQLLSKKNTTAEFVPCD
eukprot:gene24668-29807_t